MNSSSENRWNSSEQLNQASKYAPDVNSLPATSPAADPNVRRRIRAEASPRGAKMTQKCAVKAGLVRPDWDDPSREVRVQSMLWVLELKLYWNPFTFGRTLEGTGAIPIVEISKRDFFWGCKVLEHGTLEGVNLLGKLLERVRGRSLQIRRGEFTFPDGFLLP